MIGQVVRFIHHTGFVGEAVVSERTDDDGFFDCEVVCAGGLRVGAKFHELELAPRTR